MLENKEITATFTVEESGSNYEIVYSPVSLYSGTYLMPEMLAEFIDTIDENLNIKELDYAYGNKIAHDAQTLVVKALTTLIRFDRQLISVKRVQ